MILWFVLLTTLLVFSIIAIFLPNSQPLTGLLVLVSVSTFWFTYLRSFLGILRKKPALELKGQSFTDFQNGVTVEWKDVDSFWEEKGFLSSCLKLKVSDRKKYLNLVSNPLVRLQNWLPTKKGDLVFRLDFNILAIEKGEVMATIEKFDFAAQEEEKHITTRTSLRV